MEGAPNIAEGVGTGDKAFLVPILKSDIAERTVTGPVLIPAPFVDLQGDRVTAAEIRKAMIRFMDGLNKRTQAAVDHSQFNKDVRVVECYIAPVDLQYGETLLPAGTWILTVHVLDDETWGRVLSGELRGFSIGGKGRRTPAPETTQAQAEAA